MLDTKRVPPRARRAVAAVRAVVVRVQATEVTFLAAAVAYYAFLSLLPALLLLLVVASALGGDALADALVGAAGGFLTPAGETVVRNAVSNAAGRSGATLLGLVVLLWSVLKVFRALDIAFLKVYGSEAPASLVAQVRDGLVAVVGIGAGLAAMIAIGALVASTRLQLLVDLFGILVLPAVLSVVFLPLYYVFPDVEMSVAEALPGAVFAAVGWTALQAGFQIYAANAAQYETYGVLGGVLLLVTWFYLAAVVLLVGAVVNVVLAGRHTPGVDDDDLAAVHDGEVPEADREGRGVHGGDDRLGDRQLQHAGGRKSRTTAMEEEDDRRGEDTDAAPRGGSDGEREAGDGGRAGTEEGVDPAGAPDVVELQREVRRLRRQLTEVEDDVEAKTVTQSEVESDLRRYVRKRMRRGHARGWGPYLVLLYGTVLTLGAFYWLDGLVAIGAMIVLALSTLGLYVLFVMFGIGLNLAGTPVRALESIRRRRE